MPEHYAVDANVLRGTVSFRTSKLGRAYFLDRSGQQVYFLTQPTVQLTLADSTLAPAWKNKFIKDAEGRFIGMEIKFSAAQAGQVVEWAVMK